jgi:hemerythrin-like domain-containing protein
MSSIDLSLLECHGRIRHFLDGFARVVVLRTDTRAPAAAAQIARYLREGLPRHAADEDVSVAPRLREHFPDPALGALLDALAAEHVTHDAGMPAVLRLLDQLAAGDPPPADVLDQAQRWLADALLPHLTREEAELFPWVRRLPPEDQADILGELRARRR